MIIFTQCYGGSMAESSRFEAMPNTTVLSATSANQTAKFGGYDDDAARALSPGAGRTARDVHQAGAVGKKTLPPVHGAPPPNKAADMKGSEWPRTAGNLALTEFSLASVSSSGPVRSRHIVIYAGKPDVKMIRSSVHQGATIPDREGTFVNNVSDVGYRDTIKENFRDELNTTVHSVGGEPSSTDPTAGNDGWDYPGGLEGLNKALAEAGRLIRESDDPALEQFIFYITDHGGKGWKAPKIFAPVMLRSTRSAAVRGMVVNDPSLPITIDAMEADPLNQCGFFLEFAGIEASPGSSPVSGPGIFNNPASPLPGDFTLEIVPTNEPPFLITGTDIQCVDLDDNGEIGNVPGEEFQICFPLPERRLIEVVQSEAIDINVDNNTDADYEIVDLGFHTGSIAKPAGLIPPPKIVHVERISSTHVDLTVEGISNFTYAVQLSEDMEQWIEGPPTTFFSDTTVMRVTASTQHRFFRLVWVNQ